jgi:hypothetical protein
MESIKLQYGGGHQQSAQGEHNLNQKRKIGARARRGRVGRVRGSREGERGWGRKTFEKLHNTSRTLLNTRKHLKTFVTTKSQNLRLGTSIQVV